MSHIFSGRFRKARAQWVRLEVWRRKGRHTEHRPCSVMSVTDRGGRRGLWLCGDMVFALFDALAAVMRPRVAVEGRKDYFGLQFTGYSSFQRGRCDYRSKRSLVTLHPKSGSSGEYLRHCLLKLLNSATGTSKQPRTLLYCNCHCGRDGPRKLLTRMRGQSLSA